MSEIVRAALATIVEGGTLSMDDARAAMGAVMDGEATPAQLAALLMGLRMRGETVDELAGFAAAMRERVTRVEAPEGAIDVVGTGGDGSGTFNISTTAALVAAAAGVPVAKHGNRAMTSRSGSADVLDALGVRIDHDAASAGAALRDRGFAFMFAPNFHPAMKHAGPTRREIGVRTAFNLLGPLTNPAGTRRQLLGVGDAAVAARMAEVVQRLGTERTFVIHGDGVDELPLDGSGVAYIVAGDVIERHVIDAAALGFKRAATARLSGGTPDENARMTEAVLRGEPGARRDVVLLNAAAALLVGGAVEQMEEGIERAALTIDAGLATELLEALRADRRTAEAAAAAEAEARRRHGRAGTGMTVADRPARSRTARTNVVEEIAARRRADILAEVAAGPGPLIEAAWQTPAAAADRRTPRRARSPPDRRDQALVAVGRPDRGGRRGHRGARPSLRGRRRGGDLGPVRAALVRWVGRRPAGRPGRSRRPGPGQGLRGRGDPAPDAPRGRRGPRPAARGPPSGQAARAAGRAGARDRAGAAGRGPRRARARPRPCQRRPVDRAQQPRPAHARGRCRAGGAPARARARRPARHRRIGGP